MGFHLLAGIIVDAELKEKMQAVLDDARVKIYKLLDENPHKLKVTKGLTIYPFGKTTIVSYIGPKKAYDMTTDQRKNLLNVAFALNPVPCLYETDMEDEDKLKAFLQRRIEDEHLEGEGGKNG